MKHCIWCRHGEDKVSFNKLAHTIPQSLGGKDICTNVCDDCNLFFGSHYQGNPSIETILKETFNISRTRLLDPNTDIGKNKSMTKFSSVYFTVDLKKNNIALKHSYRLQKGFQMNIGQLIKRGLYKLYLEELERQTSTAHDSKYDFIREYARYGIGDLPVLYFIRSVALIAMAQDWARTPKFFIEEEMKMKYLVNEAGFFEFEFMGHVFGIATSRFWDFNLDNYLRRSRDAKASLFRGFRNVSDFNDIDLTLSILDDNHTDIKPFISFHK